MLTRSLFLTMDFITATIARNYFQLSDGFTQSLKLGLTEKNCNQAVNLNFGDFTRT